MECIPPNIAVAGRRCNPLNCTHCINIRKKPCPRPAQYMWKKLKSKWEEMGYDLEEDEFRVWYPRIMVGTMTTVDNGGIAVELDEVAIQLCDESGTRAGGVLGKAKGKIRAVEEKEESGSEGSEAEGKDDGEDSEGDECNGEDREAEEGESWRPTSRKSNGDRPLRGTMTIPIRRPKAQEAFDSAVRISKLEATIKRLEKELGTAHDRVAEVVTARDIYRTRFLQERKRHQSEEGKWREMQTREMDACRRREEGLKAENRELQARLEIEKAQNKVVKEAPQEKDEGGSLGLKSLRQSATGELFSQLFQNSIISSFFQLFFRRKNLFRQKILSSAIISVDS